MLQRLRSFSPCEAERIGRVNCENTVTMRESSHKKVTNMNVSIMGAGLAGLACAIELEKHGVQPTIYEARSGVGDRFINAEIFASIFSRRVTDEVRYLGEEHGIYLHPTSNVTNLVIHSRNRRASLTGPVGFTTIRGRHRDSLERQLAEQVRAEIQFESKKTVQDLVREHTHVVVATGDVTDVQPMQRLEPDLTVTLTGRTVQGDFAPTEVMAWFDGRFAPDGGYGFLIPLSSAEASVTLAFPEYRKRTEQEVESLWNAFLTRVCEDTRQQLRPVDSFHVHGYAMGLPRYPRIGNMLFVGNCFGAMMPAAGFGQFSSILTGIYAARDICGFGKYEELTAGIRRSYGHSLALRRLIEVLDDDGIDKVIQRLDGYWGEKLIHTEANVLKWASYASRLVLAVSGRP